MEMPALRISAETNTQECREGMASWWGPVWTMFQRRIPPLRWIERLRLERRRGKKIIWLLHFYPHCVTSVSSTASLDSSPWLYLLFVLFCFLATRRQTVYCPRARCACARAQLLVSCLFYSLESLFLFQLGENTSGSSGPWKSAPATNHVTQESWRRLFGVVRSDLLLVVVCNGYPGPVRYRRRRWWW